MLAASLLAFFGVHAATSNHNKPLNYQGRLTNSSYVPVTDGSYSMKFKIYDSASGGSCLWATGGGSDSANCSAPSSVAVSVSRGLFNVLLGDTTISNMPAMDLDFNTASYYIGVTVGSDSEMTPRQRIGASPYAYNAEQLNGLTSASFLQVGGTSGGQTTYGGSASGENLTLSSTSNSTKGKINFGSNTAYDEANVRLGLGTATPTNILSFGNTGAQTIWIENSATDVVGRALNVNAGSTIAGTSTSDVAGGNLVLASGAGTGNSTPIWSSNRSRQGAHQKIWASSCTQYWDAYLFAVL